MSATLQLVLRVDKVNAKGEAPIHIRIIKHRKVSNTSTGIKLEPKFWDELKRKVKPTHPNSTRYNAYLNKLVGEYTDKLFEASQDDFTLSGKALKEKITGANSVDFFVVAAGILERFNRDKKIGTRDLMRSVLKKIREYIKTSTLPLTDITSQWLEKYEAYLIEHLQNKTNTVHKDMRFIRIVYREAIRQDLITPVNNPFLKYKLKVGKTSKSYLTLEELELLEDTHLPSGSKLSLFRDMFIFASYTGGLRISDLLLLRWANIVDNRVVITIKKTESLLGLRIPEKGIAILSRYRSDNTTPDTLVFPALPSNTAFSDPEAVDKAISRVTALINKSLKTIVSRAGIEKSISFHCSRHSFAINALKLGMRLEYVSKALAHASVQQTQVYGKIVDSELDKAMEVFNS